VRGNACANILTSVDVVFYGLNQEAIEMSCSETNYCKKEKMSICSAEDSKQQEKCSFFEKSSYECHVP
jgi:hypothetical protein